MRPWVLAMLLLSCRCFAELPPVEGELGPPQQLPHWKLMPQEPDSDEHADQWRFKFKTGSDRCLGSAADEAAIKVLVPATIPPTVRWVSQSVVIVLAACRLGASSSEPKRCLYVVEKHRRKWHISHHYHFYSYWLGLTSRSQPLAGVQPHFPMTKTHSFQATLGSASGG
jgi:hypothetical protein